MAIGALGAWLMIVSQKFKTFIENLSRVQIATIFILFFIIYFFRAQLLYSSHEVRIFERLFIAIVIILIILEQSFAKNSFFKMSQFKTISKLGIITYGLYCLHFIGILVTLTITRKLAINTHLWQVLIIDTTLSFALSILIGKLSYKYFETPFLKLKEKVSFITK
jgi:peptidoglycan/LPS O-acetylase OafA/YrhL